MTTKIEPIIEPSRLQKGIMLVIKTTTKTLNFDMLDGGKAVVQGDIKIFKTKTPCQIIGSLDKDGTFFADKVCKDKQLVLSIPTGRHTIGAVKAAIIRGDGWEYELWGS